MARRAHHPAEASLAETLVAAGLEPRLAHLLDQFPRRSLTVDPRRPFREPGAARDEVMFVVSGLLAKFKSSGAGRRQIVALRFPGEAILPRRAAADYGIQAIERSVVLVGRATDFLTLLDDHPELARFFLDRTQRHSAIGYQWLLLCGRLDSTARVAHLLCELAERLGVSGRTRIANPFTQQQIADITGQTSVNVNRVLAELGRSGLIGREGREIIFHDWGEMRRIGAFQSEYLM